MILAMYTIRSKQNYIFATNRMLEVTGASQLITDAWGGGDQKEFRGLFGEAEKAGLLVRRIANTDGTEVPFRLREVQEAFAAGTLHMVELFCGGGNETVLFDSKESYLTANRAFSYALLRCAPGMIPLAVCVETEGEDFSEDNKSLMAAQEREKNRMIPGREAFALPFSLMDRNTFQPIARRLYVEKDEVELSAERLAKRKAGLAVRHAAQGQAVELDDLAYEKGEESMLAIVHADGNNLGAKIQSLFMDVKDYDTYIARERLFTRDTAAAFVEAGKAKMEACRAALVAALIAQDTSRDTEEKKRERAEQRANYRILIADGDDMTFLCGARFALQYTRAYLEGVQQSISDIRWGNASAQAAAPGERFRYSSCAGICIFHHHYPFVLAYALAEEACGNAKKPSHENPQNEESWLDFYYIHSSAGGRLEELREEQDVQNNMARPWFVAGAGEAGSFPLEKLEQLCSILRQSGVARTSIKTIGSNWASAPQEGRDALGLLCAHHAGLKEKLEALGWDQDKLLCAIYDLAEIYDLWFAKGRVKS